MKDTNQDISALKECIQKLTKEVENLSKSVYANKVYTNNDLMQLLGISGKLIKLYRDNGLLPFGQGQVLVHAEGRRYLYAEDCSTIILVIVIFNGNIRYFGLLLDQGSGCLFLKAFT